jgi:hypothetical protein
VDKACPANCSAHGVCWYSTLDGEEVPTCSVADTTCRARCRCSEDYFGAACSVNSTEFEGMVEFRQVGVISCITIIDTIIDTIIYTIYCLTTLYTYTTPINMTHISHLTHTGAVLGDVSHGVAAGRGPRRHQRQVGVT